MKLNEGIFIDYDLIPGEVMKVGTGHVAAFESTVGYEIEMVKEFKNIMFSGEGLF